MAKYCLIPALANKFKKMLVEGKIDPVKLSEMTSVQRREFFGKILGENNAKNVNSLFEQNLLLKNRQKAMVNWAKTVTGIKPEIRRDLISRIGRMDERVLNPKNESEFLADLASTKLGTNVTFEETQQIMNLSKVVSETNEALALNPNDKNAQLNYGMSLLKMDEYLNSVSPSKDNIAISVMNLPRALMSTLDLSAPFRQGFGMVTTKEFWGGVGKMVSYWNKQNYDKMQAMILADPYHELATRSGLKIFNLTGNLRMREDAFMSSLIDKIPGLSASERAYTGFLSKLRMDRFKTLIKQAEMRGEDVKPGSEAAKQIAHMVNNFTGAGSVGKFEPAVPAMNTFMFSPRKVMATMQILNPATYLNPKTSPTARKAAIKQLIGMVSTAGTLIGMAQMAGYEQTTDPRSADFGKIKIGDTRFDVTGGNANMAVLLARLVTGQTKSTTSGIVRDLGADYGTATRLETLGNFGRNKLSPVASFVADWMAGSNAVGEPFNLSEPSLKNPIASRLVPMIISDLIDTSMESPDMLPAVFAADMFGIGTQTYSSDVTWNANTGVELKAFKEKVGDVKFTEANVVYNDKVKELANKLSTDKNYLAKSDEEKAKYMTAEKGKIKKKVMFDYGFKYKRKKSQD